MSRAPIHFDAVSKGAVSRAETQAQRIVARFGGARKLVAALLAIGEAVAVETVYRWMYPHSNPAGVIPARQVDKIVRAAYHAGINLTDRDWSPVQSSKGV